MRSQTPRVSDPPPRPAPPGLPGPGAANVTPTADGWCIPEEAASVQEQARETPHER